MNIISFNYYFRAFDAKRKAHKYNHKNFFNSIFNVKTNFK